MDNIILGHVVAKLLSNTGRALQAIELCKECLTLLQANTARLAEYQSTICYRAICLVMYNAYAVIPDYTNAARYAKELVAMFHESGDTDKEGWLSLSLARIYQRQARFLEAKKLNERVIDIMKANGDREGEAKAYRNLGIVFYSLGEFQKANEYYEKALLIGTEIGDKEEQAECYSKIGSAFIKLRKYKRANDYFQKAHRIKMEIGGSNEDADYYFNQAALFSSLGDVQKAKEYLEKELAITLEIGDGDREVRVYNHLGAVLVKLGEYSKAENCFEKARLSNGDKGDNMESSNTLLFLTLLKLLQSNIQEANSYLMQFIQIFENFRNLNKDDDQVKISLLEEHGHHKVLSLIFTLSKNPKLALYVEELGRARALADLMTAQYSVENHISTDPHTQQSKIETLMNNERNCACLYISLHARSFSYWVLKKSGDIHFGVYKVHEKTLRDELVVDLDGLFNKSFRSFGILPRENCEDRSLDDVAPISFHDESRMPLRGNQTKETERKLNLCYKFIIAPVANLLTEPEIIIVPDHSLYRVPFAALRDESGEKYLSEKFRIRIVPSLTILKLIQDSPADYHSQTGALIVGDPKVGEVLYKGSPKNFDNTPLPCARKEAEMIGRLLGVQPLLGEHAAKQPVLKAINSVSLIHFAAHGNAERGEIALSPNRTSDSIPHEEDYLLTMSDVSNVQLRAKLVVLSCCHSGRGQINKEGVVGIARAFLGSGARSVLVALWALDDAATQQFMSRFYEHLIGGESASESLHEAMEWMRNNGFTKVSEWAPFILIGDDVTFYFENKGKKTLSAKD